MNNTSADHFVGPQPPPAQTRDWTRIGLWLVAATMAYNVAEGAIALWGYMLAVSLSSALDWTAASNAPPPPPSCGV